MNLVLLSPQELTLLDSKTFLVYFSNDDRRCVHMRNVLRVKEGDSVRIGIVNGPISIGYIHSVNEDGIRISVCVQAEVKPSPAQCIDMILGLPRPQALASIILNAAGMGVRRLFIIACERSERGYLSSKKLSATYIVKSVIEGLEQGGHTNLPDIYIYASWTRFIRESKTKGFITGAQFRYVCHPTEELSLNIFDVYKEVEGTLKTILVAIGPEGGFVDSEIDLLAQEGFTKVSLGRYILKTVTAIAGMQMILNDAISKTITPGKSTNLDSYVADAAANEIRQTSTAENLYIAAIGVSSKEGQLDHEDRCRKGETVSMDKQCIGIFQGLMFLQLPARDWRTQIKEIKKMKE